ncbi:MAG: YfiR family protein [Mariprofundaceae bacterium]|nr:YfiR family protein [Mariprofundaceae bacterium]
MHFVNKWLCSCTVLLFLLSGAATSYATESEDSVKVAIIGKLAKFVSGNTPSDHHFTIAVLNNPFGTLPDKILQRKMIHKYPVNIRYIQSLKQLKNAQVLYVPKMNHRAMKKLLQTVRGKKVLTISDSRGFAQRGGMIQLYRKAQNMRLKINLHAAQQAGLRIRSSLLKIADIVEGDVL